MAQTSFKVQNQLQNFITTLQYPFKGADSNCGMEHPTDAHLELQGHLKNTSENSFPSVLFLICRLDSLLAGFPSPT
jgi:hypothetical protein